MNIHNLVNASILKLRTKKFSLYKPTRCFSIIDGVAIARDIKENLKLHVSDLFSRKGITPGLAIILVGDRKDSLSYVKAKQKQCIEVGFNSYKYDYPENVSESELLKRLDDLNQDSKVHGIIIQLPLPSHIDKNRLLNYIHPDKDVDGLHPLNRLKLLQYTPSYPSILSLESHQDYFHIPCTPKGILELLLRSNINLCGKNVVVIGRSSLVGFPTSILLLQYDATVTIAHTCSYNIHELTRLADIVIAAAGCPLLVKGSWLKPGAVVIDVGINFIKDKNTKSGYKLVGDVDFEECQNIASLITKVPGGVGPMTIAMLLHNTYKSCVRSVMYSRPKFGPPKCTLHH